MINERQSPPKVRLTLRAGVTGHRPAGLESSDISALRSKLEHVLGELKRIVYEINNTPTSYTPEDPLLRIISPLAEGADILAAETAIEHGFELQCAIPFERGEYEKDFRGPESVRRYRGMLEKATAVFELEGSRRTKALENESYQAVGRMVLNQSDVIIAVWDGKEPRGKGGTGQIVKEAMQLEIPLIWIDSSPEHEIRVLTGNEYGAHEESGLSGLDSRLKQLLIPASLSDSGIKNAYFSETQPQRTWGVIFEVFCDFFSGDKIDASGVHVKNFEKKTKEEWGGNTSYLIDNSVSPELVSHIDKQIDESLLLHYSWADNLANYYSNVYRSSFVTNYLLAGLAVFFALLAVTAPSFEKVWIFIELLIIVSILAITRIGTQKRWHERWIDYRMLSEQIRQLRFLALLGLTTPAFRVPAHDTHGDPRNSWVNWHFRAIIRYLGIASARINKEYLQSYRSLLSEREIMGQINYHEKNSPRFQEIHKRLHYLGVALFTLTLVAVLLHFPFSSGWLTLCAAVFPALGAAFYGIRTQGEFEQIAKRSRAMSAKLKDIKKELDSSNFTPTYGEMALIAENTAEIILSETLDWRIVFQSKRLVLPV
jgi:hypothetical protein